MLIEKKPVTKVTCCIIPIIEGDPKQANYPKTEKQTGITWG